MDAKTIYLKDYKPNHYTVETINLEVDIFDEYTYVTSTLKMSVNPQSKLATPVTLVGENMSLEWVKLNGRQLSSTEFTVTDSELSFATTETSFEVMTKVKIDPANNKALEGFYKSGDQFCTQCEPEGFRKITYFLDRPDVMAKYKTKMIADKFKFPFLLSNGNRIGSGDLAGNRHWVEWEDPFKKPSYLFAMVAGDFDVARDTFKTMSGRTIDLEIYVDKGNLFKTPHAMESLKKSMKWDEDTFGLEYDLDIYMIVAVDSFNMGAMENKGLNIFNSTYTLADEKTATDTDFQGIESVIGHEYFHNWTGNRVTCRDWFQLTLKEGLTVFRDQEFSSDMLSRAVKRIEDVRRLKEFQFSEDAGPLAHPIKPWKFVEINNFYTATVYEKGAEVIRMIQTLIGKQNFRKGMDEYFAKNDGTAATTEDFVRAMEVASGRDLTQFKNWYSRAGTPTLKINSKNENGKITLNIEQVYPKTSWEVEDSNVLHMPFIIGLVTDKGQVEHKLELTKLSETFTFDAAAGTILSLNRGFSAPVVVNYEYALNDLLTLMSKDEDSYNRYEATQKVYETIFNAEYDYFVKNNTLKTDLDTSFTTAMMNILKDQSIDLSFKSYLLELPSISHLSSLRTHPDYESLAKVLSNLGAKMGEAFYDWFKATYLELSTATKFELTPKAYGQRALRNQCLNYLVRTKKEDALKALDAHYEKATNMTEEIFALNQYIKLGAGVDHPQVQKFYKKWGHDSLVMIKWFSGLAANSKPEVVINTLKKLEVDPLFKNEVPNYLRALYVQFGRTNLVGFHQADGSGYEFLGERLSKVDKFNPQTASRIATAFAIMNKLDSKRQGLMKNVLLKVQSAGVSKDLGEVISKYLA